MKKLTHLFALGAMTLPFASFGQITIQNYDYKIPVSPDIAELQIVGAGSSSVTAGTNSTWDLSGLFAGAQIDLSFDPVTSSNFPNADAQLESPVNLGGGLILDQFYDFYAQDSNFYGQVGFEIVGKDYSLGGMTGDANDTLTTWDTAIHFNNTILKFPLNYGDTWSNNFTVWIPMEITIEALSFYDDLISLRQDLITQDSVVGWGSLILPTGAQADVLLVHSSIIRVDSAFFNGTPMDPVFAQNFGFTQNDTIRVERFSFYTKGLNTAIYEYSIIDGVQSQPYYYRNNDISTGEISGETPLFIYPNPANDRLNLDGVQSGMQISICDLSGRTVLEHTASESITSLDVSSLNSGYYIVRVGESTVKVAIN